MESHLAKYRKLVPALALVCALADGKGRGRIHRPDAGAVVGGVPADTRGARAYAAGTRPETDGATALLAKIRAGAVVDGFKPADVYLKGWSYLGSPEVVKSAAQMLCDLGHLRRVVHSAATRCRKAGDFLPDQPGNAGEGLTMGYLEQLKNISNGAG
jgi:hypothetical protein